MCNYFHPQASVWLFCEYWYKTKSFFPSPPPPPSPSSSSYPPFLSSPPPPPPSSSSSPPLLSSSSSSFSSFFFFFFLLPSSPLLPSSSFFFFAWNLRSSGRSHAESLFSDEEQKQAGPWRVSDTFATHSSRVHGVTDTDRVAGHKMAALTIVFSPLSRVSCTRTGTEM